MEKSSPYVLSPAIRSTNAARRSESVMKEIAFQKENARHVTKRNKVRN